MAVKDWSVTAADNDDADNTINWLEGQAPSTVNDSARAMMAALKSWYNLIDAGTISNGTVGGTANAITLTCSPTVSALAAGQRYLFKYTSTGNTGGVTLDVDGRGAAAIQFKGAALVSGDIATNDWVLVTHDGSVFQMLNEPRLSVIATHAASVSEALTGTATNKVITPDALAAIWQRGTNIASASSLTLPSGGGNVFNVTGTTTVDGISSAQGGRCVKLYFAASLTLTHNASSFILPGGLNIITAAGDVAEFINDAAQDASGSNWRCFNYQRANGTAVHAVQPNWVGVATNYTATAANGNGVIYFGSLTADVTLSLPSAATCVGQTITMINTSSTNFVTIDPTGSETLDNLATRSTIGESRVTIFSDGLNWLTASGVYRYVSPSIALTTAATFGGAHGLGTTPHTVLAVLVCQTGEHGYAAGDRLYLPGYTHGAGGTNTGFTVGANGTNVFGVLNNNSFADASNSGIGFRHKTAGTAHLCTPANWKILVECMAS